MYSNVRGTAIRTKFAPPYAILFRGVLRQNERPCTVWAPKVGLGKKYIYNQSFFCYSVSSYKL